MTESGLNRAIDRFDLGCPIIDGSCDMVFDGSLKDKTILINVASYEDSSTGDRVAELYDIGQVFDYSGTTVKSDTTASILWNVYDAKKFTLCGGSGGPQMPGSVLIPNGSLDMKCPGLDGRIMVKGDVVQDREGSEFHAYEFDPPCDLPLPPDFNLPSECGCPTRPDILGSDFASVCGHTGVRLLSTTPDFSEGSGNEQPDKAIEDIFYNIDVGTNDRKVSFRAQNPFDGMVDMYIEYEKPYESENFRGIIGKDLTCEAGPDVEKCGALDGDAFEAVCIDPRNLGHDGEPYAFVTVYFVDKGNSLFTLSKNASVRECCQPTGIDGSSVVQYNFIISCTCPETESEAARSLLRGS